MRKDAASRILGARIKVARKAAGLTTKQLAEKTNLALNSIYQIEAGQRPGRETVNLIAAAVGVEVGALVSIDGIPDRPLRRRGHRGSSWSAEYFWQRVDKREPDECWPWTGSLNGKGYGAAAFQGKAEGAHRVAYMHSGRSIPDGLELDHICHDPDACQVPASECPHRRCCNPVHLKPVTHAANLERRRRPSRAPRGDGPLDLEAAS